MPPTLAFSAMHPAQPFYDACCIANRHPPADINFGRTSRQHFLPPGVAVRPFPLEGFDSFVGPLLTPGALPGFFLLFQVFACAAAASSLSTRRSTFPTFVFGRLSRNSIRLGTL